MIRVLHIINGLERGGAEKMLFKYNSYSKNNTKLKNITLSLTKKDFLNDRSEILDQFETYELDLKSLNIFNSIKVIKEIKKKYKIDIVQGWMYHGNLFAFIIKKFFFPKAKIFFNVRHALYNFKFENIKNIISIKIGKFLSRYVDKIIYNSEVAKKHHENIGYSNFNGIVIRNGFLKIKNEISHSNKLFPWFLKRDTIVIAKIARFHKIKAYEVFLKACEEIDKRFEIQIVCIGNGTGQKEFRKLLNNFSFKNNPLTLGEVFYPEIYLKDIDLLINSSFAESMPNIIGEAFLHGSFCIASDVGDTSLYFPNKEFLFKPGDYKLLTSKIENFINLSDLEKESIIKKSEINLLENYSLKKVCDNYNKNYGVIS
tara:strand:+ start:209 stop:1321 length:1113 start_codon:yes stop_codon:yes gene_type:complete